VSGGGPASGMRTSRRRLDGVLCHGTSITLGLASVWDRHLSDWRAR
jgi:hypothetical protein